MQQSDVTIAHNLKYIKRIRFTLNCIGAWPNIALGDKSGSAKILSLYNYFVFGACSTAMFFEFLYLKKYNNVLPFAEVGHTYITIFMGFLFLQRLTMPMQKMYCEATRDFLNSFHLMHYKDKSEYAAKINKQVHNICNIYTIVSHCQMYTGIVFYNFIPLFNSYNANLFGSNKTGNGTFEQSIYYALPGIDQYHDLSSYMIVTLFNCWLSYCVVCSFCCFDQILCVIVFHIWGHLNILKNRLSVFPKPAQPSPDAVPWYTDEESEEVRKELCSIILYHKMITEFMSRISSTYSVFLYVYFIFHQVSGCVLLLECSAMNAEAFGKYGPLTFTQFQQLIQLSIIFELICSKGDALCDEVYGLPWECMNLKNRKIIYFFLQNVQKPMAIKAGDMVPVGVQTMLVILKASFSYFIMLTTFAQEEG